ncbi:MULTISPECIES: M20 aminoacylase family protein [unclassified Aureimonas]|uniref:M20 aminoacylase family protein n=1 Tax=unclassified Aureimonas TaxID=2615206 RepID=UPI0006FD18C8|nr:MULTISPECIES: M20 aminoacylase family protein [unclassified Aureimonas]KQT53922.1 amidohydrolase [Aureimonas sp. Leaf427]KQT71638.1 amidohydrolase [Aureimonas sp. Leaf460]
MLNESRIAAAIDDAVLWRHHLHERPELLYEVEETAAFVAERLRSFGCDTVETEIGRTGVVATIRGRRGTSERRIALRADMDALPIKEETGLPYASQRPGAMHACGHDGHTAMLLGAARTLAETRDFDGTVILVFQPAEEGGAGARAMIEDGLVTRFRPDAFYGLHNIPGIALGTFAVRPGPIMAATDEFRVAITGRGGHAAIPHRTADPILAGAALVQGLQQIVSRNTDPLASLVVSVTQFHAGFAHNVIPDDAIVSGTVRSLSDETRTAAEARIRAIAAGIALAHDCALEVEYQRNYPVTVNDPTAATFCGDIAAGLVGEEAIDRAVDPLMGGEDFSYMLEQRPGAFAFIGNGPSANLHHALYDFDDRAIPYGIAYWVALTEKALSPA